MMLLLRRRSGFPSSCRPGMAAETLPIFLLVLVGMNVCCQGYFVGTPMQKRQGPVSITAQYDEPGTIFPSRQFSALFSSLSPSNEIETEITKLCEAGSFDEAFSNLEELPQDDGLKSCYIQILESLANRQMQVQEERTLAPKEKNDNIDYMFHLEQADRIIQKLLELGKAPDNEVSLPEAEVFNNIIKMWGSSTFAEKSSLKCQSYLDSLWSLHDEQKDELFVPLFESYFYAVSACSARDRGLDAAKRAEILMKEMESRCQKHPELTPNRLIANEVMNAWSKSGQKFKKGKKCEQLLEKMIGIAKSEDNDEGEGMAPDTNSFNIVINALAQGREKNSEFRAEALLERMESLSGSNNREEGDTSISLNCTPDEISFNTVLNCWATSGHKGAAERAIAILDHMKKRHQAGVTDVEPDWSTYTTVLKACARSRDSDAINRAEAVFSEYQEACESEESDLSHNAFAYNSMINCYAKSNHPDAGELAINLFETMKANLDKPGWEMCFLDVYTYTSLIDVISTKQSYEASQQAISLLEEVEESFAKTGDLRFQPNIRLYTSVVKAIARSHKIPDRVKAILDRVESSTDKEVKPDVVFYNALINAYGWSDVEGRSQKSFEILKNMISLTKSGKFPDVKPDTVSFNSVLNACAHERTKDRTVSDNIMKIVVEAFELLNTSPEYGRPDQRTYVQVLDSIATHMSADDEKRTLMAEATFLQCASNGLVGPFIIPKLFATIPRSRFEALMGSASTGKGNQLKFDVSKLPAKW
eukprot:CAMPEP_0116140704 /NCGR_PEP_ID=MMETSP0329-20121206/13998_1 /TAXON_ID=697910 /ORGANISM="Pseudo-nitzschia arenysensis, Strain B593" /LENGTH=760 /DNA_ID=CAMNT_0003635853 /DNA_START=165 /DNA_END=2444 /DNA_ORIENTATION=+